MTILDAYTQTQQGILAFYKEINVQHKTAEEAAAYFWTQVRDGIASRCKHAASVAPPGAVFPELTRQIIEDYVKYNFAQMKWSTEIMIWLTQDSNIAMLLMYSNSRASFPLWDAQLDPKLKAKR